MELTEHHAILREFNRVCRDAQQSEIELLTASSIAIAESRALLYEISRRHPEIDFDAPVRA